MAASPSYLKKRKLGWYVQVAVPRELQATFGKTVTRSLKTRDESEAGRRKHAVLAELFSDFKQAAAIAPPTASTTVDDLIKGALQEQAAVEAGEQIKAHAEMAVEASVDAFLDQQAAIHGVDAEGRPKLPLESEAGIRSVYSALRGRAGFTLTHNLSAYLREQEQHLTAQTVGDKRRWLEAFLLWFGGSRECSEVTRRVAGTYVSEVVQNRTQKDSRGNETPLSATTRAKEVGDLRTFFHWLRARGRIDVNPFSDMASTVKGSTRGKLPARRPWMPAELERVLHGVDPNDPVWSLVVISAYTGMRREEVATLKVESVDGDVLLVEEGKTEAASRRVPRHQAIAPLINRLASSTTDGYLIPGLLRGGPDRKRGWYVGKRAGNLIRKVGIEDPRLDLHAFRGTVITQLEEGGVPVSTIQLIVGHERQGITLGVYSGGVSDKVKCAAIEKVSYGSLDQYVATTGATVLVKASAKPRKKAETASRPSIVAVAPVR